MSDTESTVDESAEEARPPGPAPQGPSPEGAPRPDGGPSPSGAPPTGHPAASVDAPTEGEVVPPPLDGALGEGEEEHSLVDEEVDEAYRVMVDDLARLHSERQDYLDQLLRTRADFENYRKRILKQQTEHLERAAEGLVEKLLDVLDVFDAAMAHGQGFDQAYGKLLAVLRKEGLERIDPAGARFDPNESDAVAHEDGDGDGDGGPVVSEVLRAGYRWKGRVVRPAMVKVRG